VPEDDNVIMVSVHLGWGIWFNEEAHVSLAASVNKLLFVNLNPVHRVPWSAQRSWLTCSGQQIRRCHRDELGQLNILRNEATLLTPTYMS
jgi:hypothetical protein